MPTVLTRFLILLVALVLLAGCGQGNKTETGQIDAWPDPVMDFTMTDQTGKTVTKQDLLGRPWVACFIFTRCPLSCPVLSGEMDKLSREFKDSDIRFISFTVDPEHDTPEVLAKYAKKANANPEQWKFLTNPDKSQLYTLVHKNFKVALAEHDDPKIQPEFRIIHSNWLMYVDENARVRGKFDGLKPKDLQNLRSFLGDVRRFRNTPPVIRHFPIVNASLNGLACVLLLIGWVQIRMRKAQAHKRTMIAAFGVSIVFLGCYLTYHAYAGSKPYDRGTVPAESTAGISLGAAQPDSNAEAERAAEIRTAGIRRTVYFSVLISHIVLAAAVPVLAILTILQGLRAEKTGNWPLHRRYAWITFPIWLYVSVTGVLIYFMLYRPELVGM